MKHNIEIIWIAYSKLNLNYICKGQQKQDTLAQFTFVINRTLVMHRKKKERREKKLNYICKNLRGKCYIINAVSSESN